MVFEYEDEEEEFGYDEVSQSSGGDPVWDKLRADQRAELMNLVFNNDDWYDDGTPYHKGGESTPMFAMLSERVNVPVKTAKKYYRAWLKRKYKNGGNDGYVRYRDSMTGGSYESTSGTESNRPNPMQSPSMGNSTMNTHSQQRQPSALDRSMDNMFDHAVEQQVATSGSSDAMGMMFMMKFLGEQQQMAMQQSQFQMMQMMEQRRLDQTRESDMRREQLARDQAFMTQQMSLMKDTMKKGDNDGFFDSEMKGIFKERMVDSLLGGDKDDSWRDTVKDVLGSDTLKSAVTGIGTALGTRSAVPAGYDNPNYNPYAQSALPPQPQQEISNPPVGEYMPIAPETVETLPTDGVFFGDETPQQVVADPTPQQIPQQPAQPEIKQFSEDEYKQILFNAFTQAMGAQAESEGVMQALQQQVSVAVETTMFEIPDALPEIKLQAMNEKLMVIRNLRDIGMGLMELRGITPAGEQPSSLILSKLVGDLRANPEFYKIFATNTYDELMAKIEPFKDTGAVAQDYGYLLQPETQEICRALLGAVANDAQQSGMPIL